MVPVGEVPPLRVAVAKMEPPTGTDGDAWVDRVGISPKPVRVRKNVVVPVAPVVGWVPDANPISVVWIPGPGLLSRAGILSTE